MDSTARAVAKLQRILLTWDYWDLLNKVEEGGGPSETLQEIPNVFKDAQVPAQPTRGPRQQASA